jgi:hypothetical protein
MRGLKGNPLGICTACLILMAVGFGCVEISQNTAKKSYIYNYFPIEAVYWDSNRRIWFYPWEGTWQSSSTLPSSIRLDTRNYVVLTMDTDVPYKYHAEVARRYPPGDYIGKRKDADVYVIVGAAPGE